MMDNNDTTQLRASASEFTLPSPTNSNRPNGASHTLITEAENHNLSVTASAFIPRLPPDDSRKLSSNFSHEPQLNPSAILFRPPITHKDSLDASMGCFVPSSPGYLYHGQTSNTGLAKGTPTQKPPCRFFQQGACRRGLQCTFSHDVANVENKKSLFVGGIGGKCIPFSDKEGRGPPDADDSQPNREKCYVVDDGIRCQFGPGVLVQELQLGSEDEVKAKESNKVIIRGLVSTISDYDLEARLSTFGTARSIHRKHETYAYCTFNDTKIAMDAANNLNGTPQSTWSGLTVPTRTASTIGRKKEEEQKLGFVSVSIVTEAGYAPAPRNTTVKVHWYAPSRTAWLHFPRRSWAEKAAKTCNNKIFNQRTVVARFQPPKHNQPRSFSVWMGGLGEFVKSDKLKQFVRENCGKTPGTIQLEGASFRDNEGAPIVRKLLLSNGGPLVQFDEDVENHRFHHILKRRALAKFATAEDAARACSYFRSNTKVTVLGGTKVHCQRVYSAKFTLSTPTYLVVQKELRYAVQRQQKTTPDIRFKIFQNTNMTTSILLQADDASHLVAARGNISNIVDGELLLDQNCKREQKVPLWGDFFASREIMMTVTNKVSQRFGADYVYVLFNKRRCEVRLFARAFLKEKAADYVIQFLSTLKPDSHAVPISPDQYKFLLGGGRDTLRELIRTCHATSLSLDIKSQSLLVEGNDRDARRAVSCLARMIQTDATPSDEEEQSCPVCFCPPGEDEDGAIVQLSCFHRYCKDFLAWLCGGSQTCEYPIQCLAEGCTRPIELDELSQVLSRADFLSLLRSAVDKHVLSNQSTFQFCLSPGCNGIYALLQPAVGSSPPSRTAMCSTCHMVICCPCKVQEHEGLTCEQHMLAKLPPNQVRNHIVEEILTLKCPRCSQAFLAFDGCFALSCSVYPCRFCGWCLKDCGTNAHPHVKKCTEKVKGAEHETYFGTFPQFEEAQRKSRRQKLVQFLRTMESEKDQQSALTAIQQDLKDLKLSDITIDSL